MGFRSAYSSSPSIGRFGMESEEFDEYGGCVFVDIASDSCRQLTDSGPIEIAWALGRL